MHKSHDSHSSCHHSSSKISENNIKHNPNAIYICPMHPEVIKKGPGECPLCGMALEPEIASSDDAENPELIDFKRRFIIALLFALPVLLLALGLDLMGKNFLIPARLAIYLQFILSLPVVLWSGMPFFIRAWRSLLQRSLNMFTLIAMGTGVAFIYSIIAAFFPMYFPVSLRNNFGLIPVYFEAASMIIALVLLGQILELKGREKTGSAIKSLLDLSPQNARIITDNGDQDIAVEDIKIGNKLRIRPGEKIPIDGEVLEGNSYVDESMITGESVPVNKKLSDTVIGGTLNKNGVLIIQATKIVADTMLANIIKMVASAQRSKAPIQRLADIVAGWFVPIVIIVAVTTFILWLCLAKTQGFSYGLIAAVSVLIIACPCALGLATPMAIMVGVGRGARNGILIKDAASLEVIEKINALIVDKTGTLTEGKPRLTTIRILNNSFDENTLLQFTASLEQNSEHPLAHAIVQTAKEKNITMLPIRNFQAVTGKGIIGVIAEKNIAIGNSNLMQQNLQIDMSSILSEVDEIRSTGATVMFIAINNEIAGFMAVSDPIKELATETINKIHDLNIDIIMLTGDNHVTAAAVAKQLSIKNFHADVLPQDKEKVIQEYQSKGKIVAMAGDGINDAPALSAANVGIAMGTGTDVAIESASITLVKGDLSRLISGIRLSKVVMSNIRQNLFLAFIYNILGVPIAAGILYPVFGIMLSPIFAALAMSLSSLSVISNSLRLNWRKI